MGYREDEVCDCADGEKRHERKNKEARGDSRYHVWIAHNLTFLGAAFAWSAVIFLLITKIGLVLRMTTLFCLGVAITLTIVSVLLWTLYAQLEARSPEPEPDEPPTDEWSAEMVSDVRRLL